MKETIDIVDFHTHILPKVDHGSDSLETTLYQLRAASTNGVRRIISTSHFYPHIHRVDSFIKKRNEAYDEILPNLNCMPEIRLGAEVLICNGIEKLPHLEDLFIYGTRTLFLELPFIEFQSEYCTSVENLVKDGVNVILAHVDRYPSENIEQMIDAGAKLQINASALATVFRKKHLYNWLERGLVSAIGSDIHGTDNQAYHNFVKSISKIGKYAENVKIASDLIWNESLEFKKDG